jgi:hypothetical protein
VILTILLPWLHRLPFLERACVRDGRRLAARPPHTGAVHQGCRSAGDLGGRPVTARGEAAQTTAEYALVLLGAAAIALLLVAWATDTGKVTELLDSVVDSILDRV